MTFGAFLTDEKELAEALSGYWEKDIGRLGVTQGGGDSLERWVGELGDHMKMGHSPGWKGSEERGAGTEYSVSYRCHSANCRGCHNLVCWVCCCHACRTVHSIGSNGPAIQVL